MSWIRRFSPRNLDVVSLLRPTAMMLSIGIALAVAACGGEPARHARPTLPIPEARAIEIIRKAVRAEKQSPAEGRDIDTTSGAPLHIDVGVEGKKFGIAYITSDDLEADGASKLPKREPKALVLARGAGREENDTLVVLFFASDYRYDDHTNSEGEYTLQAVEGRLEQDVRDFINRARLKKFE
ncbi:MAG: hypothetical protein U0165_14100 [Polyangiaceae bacterium]